MREEAYWRKNLSEFRIYELLLDDERTIVPATEKQVRFLNWLCRKDEIEPIGDVQNDKALAGAYLSAITDYEHFLTLDSTTKEHIKRIWRGELKHDWTPDCPWDPPE